MLERFRCLNLKFHYVCFVSKVGQPTDDFENDPEGKKEGQFSKCMKRGAKLASKVTKMVVKNAGTCLLTSILQITNTLRVSNSVISKFP